MVKLSLRLLKYLTFTYGTSQGKVKKNPVSITDFLMIHRDPVLVTNANYIGIQRLSKYLLSDRMNKGLNEYRLRCLSLPGCCRHI